PVSHTYTNTGSFAVTLLGIDTNACIQADSAFGIITVINDSVHAAFQLNVLNACDSNLVISLINQSTNAQQYFWSFGDSTFSTQQNENHVYHLPNTYTVTLIVQDTNRCHPLDTVSQTVTMLPNLNVDFTTADVCSGTAVLFNNLSNPSSQFIWNFADGNFSNQYSPSHDYTSTGNYFVQLVGIDTNTCNVRDTATHNVIVHEQPVANFYTIGDTIGYEKPITFNNSSTDYTNLFWNFGDGTTLNDEENPVHTYETVYGVVVCLTAVNGNCIDTFCKNIFISFTSLIGVPNAFSPNGDGINDVVYVEGKGIVELDFSIYNRWGEKVFESHNQHDGWNGIYKGVLQEMEVYTYAVTAVLVNGDNKFLKGNITLLR
ncbi:MAG: PKD domain-containing protein, partial [Bacteroidetes bacterium]|nr:PKD domain-containing protein [Bacteroidota bacterium]